ncbi:hypothetical protein GCM10011519_30340 [Marmoricola endophyticus]|uniref:DUF4245 domain-containing protein n=1 Tax=Marmoricola endophyticus TaxID=2040280 RepID=A0A917BPP4_9ACTN|nr:DUF4245 family protein [Marmoricola endophyticus]GGF54370.1 hypothetical protein GCM10011519_30340 [Marmoricola endophyticus]
MSGTSGQPGRYQRSSNGLIVSIVVLVVGVLAFVLIRGALRDTPDAGVDISPVDYGPVAVQARKAGLVAPAPAPLPKGWKASSVRFTPPDPATSGVTGSWHLGLLTDKQRYVAVEETSDDVTDLLPDTVADATRGPAVRLDGRTWRSWTGAKDAYALTTAVTGGRQVLVGSPAGESVVRGVAADLSLPSQQ